VRKQVRQRKRGGGGKERKSVCVFFDIESVFFFWYMFSVQGLLRPCFSLDCVCGYMI